MCTTPLHISCVLKWSGTQYSVHGFLRTASLHISSLLKWLGINSRDNGSMHTASSHNSCVLKYFGTSFIHSGTFAKDIFFLCLDEPGEAKTGPETVIFVSDNFKTTICYFQHLFSSSGIHQSII